MSGTNKWIVAAVMLAAVIAMTLVGGMELWARMWEKRWTDFKAHWEARGESFDLAAHLPPAVDNARNFAKHPWLAAVAANDPAVMERLGKMRADELAGYSEWQDAEKPTPMPEELARRVLAHCEPFAADFAALAEAAARPSCRIELEDASGIQHPSTWVSRLFLCRKLISAHAAAALALGDEEMFTSQVVLLLDLGRHLRANNSLLCTVVGCGFEDIAYQQVTDSGPGGLKQDAMRTRLIAAIAARSRPVGEEMAAVLRFERAIALNMIDQIEVAGPVAFPTTAFSSSAAFRRVFLARNRLALCEDSQRCLFAPGGHLAAALTPAASERYDDVIRKRFKSPSVFEVIAAGHSMAINGVAGSVWHEEEQRQAALEALRGGK